MSFWTPSQAAGRSSDPQVNTSAPSDQTRNFLRHHTASDIVESRLRVADDVMQNFRAWQTAEAEDLKRHMDALARQRDDMRTHRNDLLAKLENLPILVKKEEAALCEEHAQRADVLEREIQSLWDVANLKRNEIRAEGKDLDRRMEQVSEEYYKIELRRHHVLEFQWPKRRVYE
jgi:hypothetical protein